MRIVRAPSTETSILHLVSAFLCIVCCSTAPTSSALAQQCEPIVGDDAQCTQSHRQCAYPKDDASRAGIWKTVNEHCRILKRAPVGYVRCVKVAQTPTCTSNSAYRRRMMGRNPLKCPVYSGMPVCEGDAIMTWSGIEVQVQEIARTEAKSAIFGQPYDIGPFTSYVFSWSKPVLESGKVNLQADPGYQAQRIQLGQRGPGLRPADSTGRRSSAVTLEVMNACTGESRIVVADEPGKEHFLEIERGRPFGPWRRTVRVEGGQVASTDARGAPFMLEHTGAAKDAQLERTRDFQKQQQDSGQPERASAPYWSAVLGEITLKAEPENATAWVDGVPQERDAHGMVLELTEGEHLLEVTATGYWSWTETVTVKAGKKDRRRVHLEPYPESTKVAGSTVREDTESNLAATAPPLVPKAEEKSIAPETTATMPKESEVAAVTTTKLAGTDLELVWLPLPGTGPNGFRMGSPETKGDSDEHPQRTVTIQPFLMSKTEVTVAQYRACVNANWKGCTEEGLTAYGICNWNKPARDNHPINCLDWNQAKAFAAWVGGRLPIEAEWEYAARGSAGRKYPWGDTPEPSCKVAVFNEKGTAGPKDFGCGQNRTWETCSKTSGNTPIGLCDMAGNVWEWVEDCYEDTYKGAPDNGTPRTKCSGSSWVIRGGGWSSNGDRLRAAYRDRRGADDRRNDVGFRVVRVSPASGVP